MSRLLASFIWVVNVHLTHVQKLEVGKNRKGRRKRRRIGEKKPPKTVIQVTSWFKVFLIEADLHSFEHFGSVSETSCVHAKMPENACHMTGHVQ